MLRSLRWPLAIALMNLASLAAAQVNLELSYTEESTSRIKSTFKLNQTLTIMEEAIATGQDSAQTVRVDVGSPSVSGIAIKFTIEAITANWTLPFGTNVVFDSANPGAKGDDPQAQAILDTQQSMLNASLTYRVQDRKVLAVEGMNEILRQATPAAADLLKADLDEGRLKAEYQQQIDMYPTDEVQPGQSWSRTAVLNAGNGKTLTFDRRYEYVGPVDKDGKQLEQINFFDEKVRFMVPNINASDLKIEASSGMILFDREAGSPFSTQYKTHVKGTVTLNGMDDLEFDMRIVQTTESAP